MHNEKLAPVVLFVYNRPKHTEQALESLKKNKLSAETILYVFADGPKPDAEELEKKKISETRNLIRNTTGFKQIILIEKEKNEGLANSIISGVTEIVNKYGKVIVLEDDLLVSPYFLDFMNEGLEIYKDSANIYTINGFMFPIKFETKGTVLLPFISTWGWATWQSKWKAFNNEMKGKELIKSNLFLANKFDLAHYHYTDMLDFGNNSWGIKWYFSVFIRNGLNVFPTQSLVKNIGFDASGENCKSDNSEINFDNKLRIVPSKLEVIDLEFYGNFLDYFSEKKKSWINLLKKSFKW